MARHSTKTTRTTRGPSPKRTTLEGLGSRWCAGYEVMIRIDPTQTNSLGRVNKARATGERE